MCGRFTLDIPVELLIEIFDIAEAPFFELWPRYNIAPTQGVPVVRQYADYQYRLDSLRWGLIPSWTKEALPAPPLINARSETVAEKPTFRQSIKYRRCLIPATGFFEWLRQGDKKTPLLIRLKESAPLIFAGIWESWKGPDGKTTDSCAILTTEANTLVAPAHDRMPVILRPQDWKPWLDRDMRDPQRLKELYAPYPADEMEMFPVSSLVNSTKNDSADLIVPAST
jgi:putative SOS response-associated peptidase YedK